MSDEGGVFEGGETGAGDGAPKSSKKALKLAKGEMKLREREQALAAKQERDALARRQTELQIRAAERAEAAAAKEGTLAGRLSKLSWGKFGMGAVVLGVLGYLGLSHVAENVADIAKGKTEAGKGVAEMRRDIASLSFSDTAKVHDIREVVGDVAAQAEIKPECKRSLTDAYGEAAKSAIEQHKAGKGDLSALFIAEAEARAGKICQNDPNAVKLHKAVTKPGGSVVQMFAND